MGRATVWIRKENQAKWDSLKDKSEWLNERLQEDEPVVAQTGVDAVKDITPFIIDKKIDLCPHGAGKGLCTVKGCKYYQFKRR